LAVSLLNAVRSTDDGLRYVMRM